MPNILVIGGLSVAGRHLCLLLQKENNLINMLCIVDKRLPQFAFLSGEMIQAIMPHFVQGDMGCDDTVNRVFSMQQWDWVFNFQSDVTYNQDDEIYKHVIYDPAVKCGKKAAEQGVKCYIALSSFEVYQCSHEQQKEDAPLRPSTKKGKWKMKAEKALQEIPNLNLVIVRPAMEYGPHCSSAISTILALGSVYQYLDESFIMPGKASTKRNLVHVNDVARAFLHLAKWYTPGIKRVPIFNIGGKSDCTQQTQIPIYKTLFNIEIKFADSMFSSLFSKFSKEELCSEINESTLSVWNQMLREAGISVTPISPYLDSEFLELREVAIDGSKIEHDTGFVYSRPVPKIEYFEEMFQDYIERKLWPKVIGKMQVQKD